MKVDSGAKSAGAKLPQTAAQQAAAVKGPAAGAKASASEAKSAAAVKAPSPSEAEAPPAEDKKAAKARAKQEKKEAKALAKAEKAEQKKAGKSEKRKPAGGGGIKHFFVMHGEKFLISAAGIAALALVYMSFNRLELDTDHSSEDLTKQVDNVNEQIRNAVLPIGDFPSLEVENNLRRWRTPVGMTAFSFPTHWDDVLVPPQKRGEPEIYAVEDPLAIAGSDLIYVKPHTAPAGGGAGQPHVPAAAGHGGAGHAIPFPPGLKLLGEVPPVAKDEKNPKPAQTAGRTWVAILAVLPRARQSAEYNHQFANAFEHKADRDDMPLYSEVRMMRLEIPPGVSEKSLDWSKAKVWDWPEQVIQNSREESTWAMTAHEIMPEGLVCDDSSRLPAKHRALGMGVLTKHLAPLASRSWHQWSTHPRLADEIAILNAPAKDAEPVQAEDEAKGKEEAAPPPKPAGGGPGEVDVFDQKPANVPGPATKKNAPKTPEKARAAKPAAKRTVDYQLVRVFDYTVEPGKRYRYQLQVAVRNPNFEDPQQPADLHIKLRNLKRPECRKDSWLFSPWSAPTNEVTVPAANSLLAVAMAVDAAEEAAKDAAKVFVRLLDSDGGKLGAAPMTLHRGDLASGIAKVFRLDPAKRQVSPPTDEKVETDFTLVDFHPVGRVPAEIQSQGLAPCEMLFIDSRGQMIVQSSVQDEGQSEVFKHVIAAFSAPATPPGGTPKSGDPMNMNPKGGDDAGALFNNGADAAPGK